MKKALSVVTAPFRFLYRLLRRLLGLVVKAVGGVAKLRGKALAAALVAILAVLAVAVIFLKPGPDGAEQVRETLDRYAEATRDKDYQRLCDELYAKDLVERIRSAGLPCEVALRTGLEDRVNPRLDVLAVEVTGDQAAARVRSTAVGEVASTDTVRLVNEGDGWRVSSLIEPGASAPIP